MFGDEPLLQNPKHFGPNFANGVDAPVPWLVEELVRRRIYRVVSGISIVADTLFTVGGPSAHRVILVSRGGAN